LISFTDSLRIYSEIGCTESPTHCGCDVVVAIRIRNQGSRAMLGLFCLMSSRMDDYLWTTGGQENISHVKLIAVGGYGEVHQVRISVTALTIDAL